MVSSDRAGAEARAAAGAGDAARWRGSAESEPRSGALWEGEAALGAEVALHLSCLQILGDALSCLPGSAPSLHPSLLPARATTRWQLASGSD